MSLSNKHDSCTNKFCFSDWNCFLDQNAKEHVELLVICFSFFFYVAIAKT